MEPASPLGLETILKRDRAIVIGAISGITIIAWLYMVRESRAMYHTGVCACAGRGVSGCSRCPSAAWPIASSRRLRNTAGAVVRKALFLEASDGCWMATIVDRSIQVETALVCGPVIPCLPSKVKALVFRYPEEGQKNRRLL